jgi:uridine kinase
MKTPRTTPTRTSGDAGALLDEVMAGPARLGSTRLVCVDGPAGSGKTTLAALLASSAVARGTAPSVVHMDDVYDGWDGLVAGVTNIGHWLLVPLRRDEPGGYNRYDWAAGGYAEWHAVFPGGLLVLEGVGAAASQVDGLASLRVWVELPLDERTTRWRKRDRGAADPFIDTWQAQEQAHFRADRTRQRADVCWVPGTDWSAD